ncbi:Hsp20/alpha crystallin family protein [Alicyclobacillus fastidiosus]|uniref:Hsp20/alpha crystallin family protein n=1 Tax=Alicyclobacillus fastidiosus TaxID=392011 RepID=A0ABY6ZCT6_9BACL|nr:Hsp20/alpha crystallin family protein [Alicyclobacillus fastidiosus]WAH40327.1 Hsp20/alpha crystallin family protein [Alicyclobacillus fastidiosus]GMA61710.1 hypothetical protein GCM10025859_21500 [Alicyclobacillus fastidiosus]
MPIPSHGEEPIPNSHGVPPSFHFNETLGANDIDLRETETDITIHAALPGMEKLDDVYVIVSPHAVHLYLKPHQQGGDHPYRTIALPTAVDEAFASAVFTNGKLCIKIPKLNLTFD